MRAQTGRRQARRPIRLAVTVAAMALVVGVLLVPVTPAGARGATQIEGVATFDEDGTCTDDVPSLFTMRMAGDLEGCWYTPGWDVVQETPSGVYQERGNEVFVGCLVKEGENVACGSFATTYKLTQKYGPDGVVHGRCQHPIVAGSGTGDFDGATGRVDFKEDVDLGVAYFRGHISLS